MVNIFMLFQMMKRKLFVMNTQCEILKTYHTPYADIEGICIKDDILYLARDSGSYYKIQLTHKLI